MRVILLFLSLFPCFVDAVAQEIQFEQLGAATDPIYADFEILHGEVFFADLNGDSYKDVIISGVNDPNYFDKPSSILYMNDGKGNFYTQKELPFKDISISKIDFADFDADGDLDMLIGTTIYENDGLANFSVWEGLTTMDNNSLHKISFFDDIDGDGDVDLFSVESIYGESFVRLMYNDGSAHYTMSEEKIALGKGLSDIVKSVKKDLNNDGYNDFVICTESEMLFYVNNGLGSYRRELLSVQCEGFLAHFDIADVNGDSLPDMILLGFGWSGESVGTLVTNSREESHLFINKGDFNFIYEESIAHKYSGFAVVQFIDFDKDGDQDLFQSGAKRFSNGNGGVLNEHKTWARMLKNDGKGHFADTLDLNIQGFAGEAYVEDLNNDQYQDLLMKGNVYGDTPGIMAVINNQDQSFTGVYGSPFRHMNNIGTDLSDVDGDGDLDVLVFGAFDDEARSLLYINDGDGNYIEDNRQDFHFNKAVFIDVDADGYDDIIANGKTLYHNNGTGLFSERERLSMLSFFDVEVADLNNDGLEDVLIGNKDGYLISYINAGNGTLKWGASIFFEGNFPYFTLGDIDGDGDPDMYANTTFENGIYENDGTGKFVLKTEQNFVDVYECNTAFSDLDGDGDLDLLLSGRTSEFEANKVLLLNDGNGHFTEKESSILGLGHSNLAFFDADNDGDNDLVLSGAYSDEVGRTTKTLIYANNGDAVFTEVETVSLASGFNGLISIGDIDNDEDMDLFISGQGTANFITRLYRNTTCWPVPNISDMVESKGNVFSALAADYDYQWVNCDENDAIIEGANEQSYHTYEAGNYAVIISDGDCKIKSDCYELRLEDLAELPLMLYPNPAQNSIVIEGTTDDLSSISIYNVLGQQMPTKSLEQTSQKISIDISSYESGLYFVKSNQGDLKFSKL